MIEEMSSIVFELELNIIACVIASLDDRPIQSNNHHAQLVQCLGPLTQTSRHLKFCGKQSVVHVLVQNGLHVGLSQHLVKGITRCRFGDPADRPRRLAVW